jgi:hypothetical protein
MVNTLEDPVMIQQYLTPKYLPKKMKTYVHTKICTSVSRNFIHSCPKLEVTQILHQLVTV